MTDESPYDDAPPDATQLWRENRELERANRELRGSQKLWVAGLASWTVATVIWCTWTTPLGISNATDADWSFVNLGMAVLLGALAYGMLFAGISTYDQEPSARKLIAASVVIPIVLIGVGFALRPKHLVESRSLRAFDSYTGRFPSNALGDPYIAELYENIAWVCAKQVQTRETHFCTVVWTGEKYRGDFRVAGGFRFNEGDQVENKGVPVSTFDCFGTEREHCGD